MNWQQADFKGKQVWVAVDGGKLVAERGRVPMRYSDKPGAKVYGASPGNVVLDPTSMPLDLDAGVSADAPAGKKKKASGFGSAGSRTQAQAAMAKEAALKMVADLDAGVIKAFTDGGCRGNPGPAGSGAVVVLPDGRRAEASRSLGRATNNVGELTAIGMVMELLEQAKVPADAPIALFTDSDYATGVLTRGWKAKANTELILDLRARLKKWPGLQIHWIAGHVGIPDNERADRLANQGIEGTTKTSWS